MSVNAMGRIWGIDVPHAHKFVLLSLADHADHEGEHIYPGIGLIAWKCGYSVRQTQRIMAALQESGIIEEVSALPGKPVVYRINFDAAPLQQPYKSRQNVTPVKMSPVTNTTQTHDIYDMGGVTFESANKEAFSASEQPELPIDICTNHHGNHGITMGRETPPPQPTKTKTKAPAPKITADPNSSVSGTAHVPPPPRAEKKRDPNLDHPAVQVYRELACLTPNAVQRAAIVSAVQDLEAWRATVENWMRHGWQPKNVDGMLDSYSRQATEQARKREPYQPPPVETPWRAPDAMTPEETGRVMTKLFQEYADRTRIPPVFGNSA